MNNAARFVQALAGLALLGVVLGAFVSPRASTHRVEPIWLDQEMRSRPAGGRLLAPLGARLPSLGASHGIGRPALVKVDSQDRIWALDYADFKVKRFSPTGQLQTAFGAGRGAEDGQFTNPTDFSWTSEGGLWVTDPVHRRLTRFDPHGDLEGTQQMDEAPYRIARVEDGSLVSMALGSVDELFVERDPEMRVRGYFGRLNRGAPSAIAFDGWLAASGDQLVYAPAWLDVVTLYRNREQPIFVETLDPTPAPLVITDRDGNQSLDPRSWATHRSLSITDRHFAVYTVSGRGPERRGFLDIFTLEGRYHESLELPYPVKAAVLGPTTVVALGEDGIERWRRPSS